MSGDSDLRTLAYWTKKSAEWSSLSSAVDNDDAPRASAKATSTEEETGSSPLSSQVQLLLLLRFFYGNLSSHAADFLVDCPAASRFRWMSFRSLRFFELPPLADTGTCSAEKPCFLSDHMIAWGADASLSHAVGR